MASRPNIISIVSHDLGRMLGCYGRGFASPNLDRFAAQGARLTQAYCASTACSPSRGCAWTGQHAHTNGLMGLVNRGWSLPVARRTIVDHLNDAGYHTALAGLDHVRAFPQDHRFREYLPHDPRTAVAVDHAIDFLRGRGGRDGVQDQPFYLNLGTIEVHGSQWGTWFQGRDGEPGPPLEVYGWGDPDRVPVPPAYTDCGPARRELANFQACIAYLDFHLGRLFNAIERLGLADDTLVMFHADHGMEGLRGKMSLYELGTEIACMIRGPGIAPGTVVDDLAQNIDWVPTLLEAAGVPDPGDLQGRSLWPRLAGGAAPDRGMIFDERNYHAGAGSWPDGTPRGWDPMRSVRTPRWHLVRNFGAERTLGWTPETVPEVRDTFASYPSSIYPPATEPRPEVELFDRQADPYDWHDVADDPAHAAVKAELLTALDVWMQDTADPLLDGVIPDRLHPHPEAPTHG